MINFSLVKRVSQCLLAALFWPAAYAVPANPSTTQVSQPDGTKLSVQIRGDEYQGWLETTDGYTILKNKSNRRFEYATQLPTGELVSSHISATAQRRIASGMPGLRPKKGLRPPRNVRLEREQNEWLQLLRARRITFKNQNNAFAAPAELAGPGPANSPQITGTWAPVPVTGPKKVLVLLVSFQDVQIRPGGPAYWSNLVFNTTQPSVSTFYRDNSYGKVTISPVNHTQSGSPLGVVSVALTSNNPNYGNQFDYDMESGIINSAINAAAKYVDFAALDENGDGEISVDEALIYFVFAGYETAAGSGLEPSVWAHRWSGPNVAVSGKKLGNWALNGEMYNATTRMQMGVVAHEMGHAMGGLPDLYDVSSTNSGLGAFSIMAAGSWGGKDANDIPGQTPVGMDAWSRQYLGWSSPRYVSGQSTLSFASGLVDPSSAVLLMDANTSTTEYWLVENRTLTGWDAGMYQLIGSSQGGLLVQHIDTMIGTQQGNSFNLLVPGMHQGNVVVEPASAQCDLIKSSASSGCSSLFYYFDNAVAFDDTATPAANYYSGKPSGLGVTMISSPAASMTAVVHNP